MTDMIEILAFSVSVVSQQMVEYSPDRGNFCNKLMVQNMGLHHH